MASRALRLSSQCRLVDRVRDLAKAEAALTIIASWGLTICSLGSSDFVRVFLLCRNKYQTGAAS